jgi:hypothetical protein
MAQARQDVRQFSVHARHVDSHHAHVVKEASFEAAAIAYIEDFSHFPGDEPEISVIVRDVASGHEHCFRVDLGSGETTPCE